MTRITLSALSTAALLAACSAQPTVAPSAGPVAAPQVVYRIDDRRYFEVVPLESLACARARLYYTDTARGIHVNVASWDRVSKGTFVIDAANKEYLAAPVIQSSSGCQSGDGTSYLCADSLHYSLDGGREWKVFKPVLNSGAMRLIGPKFYVGDHETDVIDISSQPRMLTAWHRSMTNQLAIPRPTQDPIDNQFHCTPSGNVGHTRLTGSTVWMASRRGWKYDKNRTVCVAHSRIAGSVLRPACCSVRRSSGRTASRLPHR